MWNLVFCSFSQVGGVGRNHDGGTKWRADCVKNYVKGRTDEHNEVLKPVFKPNRAALLMSSRISSIRLGPKCSSHAVNDGHIVGRALYPFEFFWLFLCKHYIAMIFMILLILIIHVTLDYQVLLYSIVYIWLAESSLSSILEHYMPFIYDKIDLEVKDLNMKIDLLHWDQRHQVEQFILLILLNH